LEGWRESIEEDLGWGGVDHNIYPGAWVGEEEWRKDGRVLGGWFGRVGLLFSSSFLRLFSFRSSRFVACPSPFFVPSRSSVFFVPLLSSLVSRSLVVHSLLSSLLYVSLSRISSIITAFLYHQWTSFSINLILRS